MKKDTSWKVFFSRNDRYADIINGLGCGGGQMIRAEDLQEADSGSGRRSRDVLRKATRGMNFMLVGIENQDRVDYAMPFRNMVYDVGTYEKQMETVRREVREHPQGILPGEYLYGFRKDSRLHPVITFVLYSGEEPWDGAESLHEILDFTDVPESLRSMVSNYRINVIDIRRFEHSEVFQTDVKQVFDFLRFSEDKEALLKLVEEDEAYTCLEEDAFEVMASYSSLTELMDKKEKEKREAAGKGERKDMGNALRELMEDSRAEGKAEGKAEVIRRFLLNGGSEEEAERMLGVTREEIASAREPV